MKKSLKIFLIVLVISIILIFLIQFTYKSITTGNNIGKSTNDLIDYILNISSYEAILEVTVNSSKTTNKYILEQYYMQPTYSKQIVREPENIKNLEIIYTQNKLEIRNSNLGLSKIYENYNYLNKNLLWLNYIIQECKKEYKVEENEEEVILNFNIEKYSYKGVLYLNKKTSLPTKIEIVDNNNQNKIYIEYKEIKFNNIQENNIFAFETKDIRKEV